MKNKYKITARRLRMFESVILVGRDAPDIISTLLKMGIPRRQIGTVLVGETIRRNDTLTNPEDGESHCIRYCDIRAVYDEFDRHYYLTIDGHSVADFFANVTAMENILMETDMDSAFGRVWERGL